jgi:hypothetical protein
MWRNAGREAEAEDVGEASLTCVMLALESIDLSPRFFLHDDFGADPFNRNNIVLRKIKLKECKSPKLTTKGGGAVDKTQEYISYESVGQFPIARFL